MSWLSRLANAFRSRRMDRELDEELRFHMESRKEEMVRQGVSAQEAERTVRRRMGNSLATRERSRDIRLMPWMESLWRDLRFGMRVLAKDRVVTAAAVVSLALAIGACTAAFALIDAMILRPLPVPQPGRLFFLTSGTEEEAGSNKCGNFAGRPFDRHGRAAGLKSRAG